MSRQKSTKLEAMVRRIDVLKSSCPHCEAKAGERCTGSKGLARRSAHKARWETMDNKPVTDPRDIECSTCGAQPGHNCTSPNGHIRQNNHIARKQELKTRAKNESN